MDISIEAIEADLALAEARAGQAVAQKYLVSAQVRATLLASGVPAPEPVLLWDPDRSQADRLHMASAILGMARDELEAILDPMAGSVEPPTTSVPPVEEEIVSVEPDDEEDDDMDADFERLKKR